MLANLAPKFLIIDPDQELQTQTSESWVDKRWLIRVGRPHRFDTVKFQVCCCAGFSVTEFAPRICWAVQGFMEA